MADPHDDLLVTIRELVREELDPALPYFAEVRAAPDGQALVHDDGVAKARIGGTRLDAGRRTVLLPVPGGDAVALGPIVTGAGGQEQVVGNDDLATDAVDGRVLRTNAVAGRHVANDQIEVRHLRQNSVGPTQLAPAAVQTSHLRDGSVTAGKLDQSYTTPVQLARVEGKADDGRSRAIGAQSTADRARAEAAAARSQADRALADAVAARRDADRLAADVLTLSRIASRQANDVLALERRVKRLE